MFHLSISSDVQKYSFVRTEGYDHKVHVFDIVSKMSGFTYGSVRFFCAEH